MKAARAEEARTEYGLLILVIAFIVFLVVYIGLVTSAEGGVRVRPVGELEEAITKLKPGEGIVADTFVVYVVKFGDTLSAICRDYGFSVSAKDIKELAEYNDIRDPNWLRPGTVLVLPKGPLPLPPVRPPVPYRLPVSYKLDT